MKQFECGPCGYIYDPAEGDPENNIEIGTKFEDLPDDWECPQCGADKEYFEKLQLIMWEGEKSQIILQKGLHSSPMGVCFTQQQRTVSR